MPVHLSFIRPLCPSPSVRPSRGDDWLHEPKWDGFRFEVINDGASVRFYSRSGAEYADRLPRMGEAFGKLPAQSAILDGEFVLLDPREGRAFLPPDGADAHEWSGLAMYVVRKITFAVLMLTSALIAHGGSVRAAELVMFEKPGCPWCQRWHAEIGPAYSLTAEGQAAPLRRSHIRDQALAGVLLERPITVTPTFVLAEEGREVGRIVGYPGEDFFYGLLANLLKSKP